MKPQASNYKCDRCQERDAIRVTTKMSDGPSVELDICPSCAVYGFCFLLKQMDPKTRDKWVKQFMSRIIN